MLGKRIMCLLGSLNFIIAPFNANTLTPFNKATQVFEKQVDNNRMVFKTNEFGIVEHPMISEYKRLKAENEKKKAEEEAKRQKEKELEERRKKEPQWQEFILTFYTSLESENSSAGAVTSQGKKLSRGGVANNVIPQNTRIYLEKYGQVIVNDKGSNKHFSVDNRLDVFIEREYGESDKQYSIRVSKMGIQRVNGYIVNK